MPTGLSAAGSPYRLFTAAEVRDLARLASGMSDAAVNLLLDSAVATVERELARSLLENEWTYLLDAFPDDGAIRLPIAPVKNQADVEYWDADTDAYVATGSTTLTKHEPARVIPPTGESWPTPADVEAAVRVIFVAGYGTTATQVPADLKRAVLMLVSHYHENPQAVVVGSDARTFEVPMGVQELIDLHRWTGFF